MFTSMATKTLLELSDLVSEKARMKRIMNEYLELNDLPFMLRSNVKRCINHCNRNDKMILNEEKVLAILPMQMQCDLLYEVRGPLLLRHSLFDCLATDSLRAVRHVCRNGVSLVAF